MESIFSGYIANFNSLSDLLLRYEAFKKVFNIKTNDILGYSKIALFSGVITSTCANPFWIINAKMMIHKVFLMKFFDFF